MEFLSELRLILEILYSDPRLTAAIGSAVLMFARWAMRRK